MLLRKIALGIFFCLPKILNPMGYHKNPFEKFSLYKGADLSLLKSLLSQGVHTINSVDAHGTPPLAKAIYSKNIVAVELLLEHGADSKKRFGKTGRTPLIWCIHFGTPEITQVLIDTGSALNTKDEHPLIFEVVSKHYFRKDQLRNLAILFRSGLNPSKGLCDGKNIFEYMADEALWLHQEAQRGTENRFGIISSRGSEKLSFYKRAARAIVLYKILWLHLTKNSCFSPETAEYILTFVDFGLDDYHTPKAPCVVCWDKKPFNAIPCPHGEKHGASICTECMSKLGNCPLCREKLSQ